MDKPLDCPFKEQKNRDTPAKEIQAVSERNEIEAVFGIGKRVCRTNNIKAKLLDAAESWPGVCYFAKNVMKFLKELLYALFLIPETRESSGKYRGWLKGKLKVVA
ncbi:MULTISPECIES: hypothetical protein [Butyricimonas]|uniref:hypothetical protein n=1 Tax=Butyricimonas TaxID=574697 RepID=UPI0007FB2837|nr:MULTISPECIES: hypothetical protein [Butyricimonas]